MVKIYKTQSEIETDIKNGVLVIQGDVKFECSVSINASIEVISGNINAKDIDAEDIDANDIDADNILYFAFCGVYNSIRCLSIKAKREKHAEPICLAGSLKIGKPEEKPDLSGKEVSVIIDGKTYTAVVK